MTSHGRVTDEPTTTETSLGLLEKYGSSVALPLAESHKTEINKNKVQLAAIIKYSWHHCCTNLIYWVFLVIVFRIFRNQRWAPKLLLQQYLIVNNGAQRVPKVWKLKKSTKCTWFGSFLGCFGFVYHCWILSESSTKLQLNFGVTKAEKVVFNAIFVGFNENIN